MEKEDYGLREDTGERRQRELGVRTLLLPSLFSTTCGSWSGYFNKRYQLQAHNAVSIDGIPPRVCMCVRRLKVEKERVSIFYF